MVQFDENGLNGKSGYCFGSAWWDKSKVIYRGELRLNPTRIKDFDRCAIHEPMHSFGFLSHPHAAPSVLSYVNKAQRTLTPLDADLIHTLYDSRLTAGMVPAAASQLACRILAERMKSAGPDIEAVCRNRRGAVIGELSRSDVPGAKTPGPHGRGLDGSSSLADDRGVDRRLLAEHHGDLIATLIVCIAALPLSVTIGSIWMTSPLSGDGSSGLPPEALIRTRCRSPGRPW